MAEKRRSNQAIATLASTALTVLALFGAQAYYEQYATLTDAHALHDGSAPVQDLQATQRAQLASGPLAIGDAMARLAEADRRSIPLLAPEASADPAPAAGWMHGHDYVAPPAPLPVEEAPPILEAPTDEGDVGTAAPPAADASPTAAVPAPRPALAAPVPAPATPAAAARAARAAPAPAAAQVRPVAPRPPPAAAPAAPAAPPPAAP